MKKLLIILCELLMSIAGYGQLHLILPPYVPAASTPITFIGQTGKASTTGIGVTTGTLNTTGASLIVICISSYSAAAAPVVSDSKGNTWTPKTVYVASSEFCREQQYYCYAPITATNQTFTVAGSSSFPALQVLAFSNTLGSWDVESGGTGAPTPALTGSATPSHNGEVAVVGIGGNYTTALTAITSGFTHYDNGSVSGTAFFLSGAYLIQTTAAPINCSSSWTSSSGANGWATSIEFYR